MFDRLAHLNSVDRSLDHSEVHPRDAASLIIVDDDISPYSILMGRRHAAIEFVPDVYVFPGGRIQQSDTLIAEELSLKPAVAELLALETEWEHGSPNGCSLIIGALRETFEETGLIPNHCSSKLAANDRPNIASVDELQKIVGEVQLLSRSITPPGRPKRFDTRFFVAPKKLFNTNDLAGDGELVDLQWVSYEQALKLPLHVMPRVILEDINDYMTKNSNLSSLDLNRAPSSSSCAFYTFADGNFHCTRLQMQSCT